MFVQLTDSDQPLKITKMEDFPPSTALPRDVEEALIRPRFQSRVQAPNQTSTQGQTPLQVQPSRPMDVHVPEIGRPTQPTQQPTEPIRAPIYGPMPRVTRPRGRPQRAYVHQL